MRVAAFFIALLSMATVSYADTMTVDADTFDLYQAEQRGEFRGNVVAHRGDMTLKSDFIRVHYRVIKGKNELKSIEAQGNVVMQTPQHQGASQQMTFSADSELVILTGQAWVESPQGVLKGEQIEYNIATKDTKVLKGEATEQVHFQFGEETSE